MRAVYLMVLGAALQRLLHLDGDVLDSEVVGGDLPQATQHGFELLGWMFAIDQHVRGECVVPLGNGPDVNVVNHDDALHLFHLAAETIHVDMLGYAFEQDVDHLGEKAPGAEHDENGDDDADDGVGERPPEGPDEST